MFAIDTRLLPCVGSYQDAVALFEKLPEPKTPLAFNEKLLKGRTRDYTKRIRRTADGVRFIYHATTLVHYHAEDHITITHHSSVSSRMFIDCFLPKGMWTRGFRDETAINGYLSKKGVTDWYFRDGQWQPDPNDVQAQYKLRLNRAKAAKIKDHIMPFLEWRDGLEALQGRREVVRSLVTPRYAIENLLLADTPLDTGRFGEFRRPITSSASDVLHMAYVVGGAVEQILLPPGHLPLKSTWDKWRHLLPDTSNV